MRIPKPIEQTSDPFQVKRRMTWTMRPALEIRQPHRTPYRTIIVEPPRISGRNAQNSTSQKGFNELSHTRTPLQAAREIPAFTGMMWTTNDAHL